MNLRRQDTRSVVNGWEGWIHKQGSLIPSWKKRFMVLIGREIAYYDRDVKDTRAKEKGYFLLKAVYQNHEIANGMTLVDADGKRMNIYTQTVAEFDVCFRAMKNAVIPERPAVQLAEVKSVEAAARPLPPRQPSTRVVQHAGWLEKEGEVMPTWKRRYFVLTGTQLQYFKTSDRQDKKGGGRVLEVGMSDRPNGLYFYLDTNRILNVVADSERDAQGWFAAASLALGRPLPPSNLRRPQSQPTAAAAPQRSDPQQQPVSRSASMDPRVGATTDPSFRLDQGPVQSAPLSHADSTANIGGRRKKDDPSHLPTPAPPEVTCAGWLLKQSDVLTGWRRWYFILRGRDLRYFDKATNGLQKGGGRLTDVTWSSRHEAEHPRRPVLDVVMDDGTRVLRLSADAPAELQRWHDAACHVLGRPSRRPTVASVSHVEQIMRDGRFDVPAMAQDAISSMVTAPGFHINERASLDFDATRRGPLLPGVQLLEGDSDSDDDCASSRPMSIGLSDEVDGDETDLDDVVSDATSSTTGTADIVGREDGMATHHATSPFGNRWEHDSLSSTWQSNATPLPRAGPVTSGTTASPSHIAYNATASGLTNVGKKATNPASIGDEAREVILLETTEDRERTPPVQIPLERQQPSVQDPRLKQRPQVLHHAPQDKLIASTSTKVEKRSGVLTAPTPAMETKLTAHLKNDSTNAVYSPQSLAESSGPNCALVVSSQTTPLVRPNAAAQPVLIALDGQVLRRDGLLKYGKTKGTASDQRRTVDDKQIDAAVTPQINPIDVGSSIEVTHGDLVLPATMSQGTDRRTRAPPAHIPLERSPTTLVHDPRVRIVTTKNVREDEVKIQTPGTMHRLIGQTPKVATEVETTLKNNRVIDRQKQVIEISRSTPSPLPIDVDPQLVTAQPPRSGKAAHDPRGHVDAFGPAEAKEDFLVGRDAEIFKRRTDDVLQIGTSVPSTAALGTHLKDVAPPSAAPRIKFHVEANRSTHVPTPAPVEVDHATSSIHEQNDGLRIPVPPRNIPLERVHKSIVQDPRARLAAGELSLDKAQGEPVLPSLRHESSMLLSVDELSHANSTRIEDKPHESVFQVDPTKIIWDENPVEMSLSVTRTILIDGASKEVPRLPDEMTLKDAASAADQLYHASPQGDDASQRKEDTDKAVQHTSNIGARDMGYSPMCTPDSCDRTCKGNKFVRTSGTLRSAIRPGMPTAKHSRCTPDKCELGCKANKPPTRPPTDRLNAFDRRLCNTVRQTSRLDSVGEVVDGRKETSCSLM
ncbi:Aste57867_645 [Aphanomyces stellatus]|uniref:Aste57867_645 protein n=1 Tax=Aphanomyces stellatus TaxID=120398 RepID=A0A485K3H6_9STRA|nr:hypothetical protein As57867_000644 [Aphanomyces stellatus]VFT77870.1 Aste57867_645 [Aphanomyces stellatus]